MYRRIRSLGRGYFGEVWLEEDMALGRMCAAKYLTGPGSIGGPVELFAEARSMLRAENDHVVQVYSAEIESGVPVIRMEYLPDGSIVDRYGSRPLPVGIATSVIEDACRGLECLHTKDLLHRDLKPANLLVSPTGSVKISDFGLACQSSQTDQAPIGYLPHLPPEAFPSPQYIDTRAGDIYAMGVTLYRLLNGDSFLVSAKASTAADLQSLIASGALPPRNAFEPHVHESLRRIIRKALHLDPAKRFKDASEMRHALEGARARVSWNVRGGNGGLTWEGESADGSSDWRAELTSGTDGRVTRFRLERRLPGKSFRSVRSAAGSFYDRSMAMKHAAETLQRVASQGR